MSNLHDFLGPNAGYVLELYDRFLANPETLEPEWRKFFATFDATPPVSNIGKPGPAETAPVNFALDVDRIVGAAGLALAIREYGHLAANLDPLGNPPPGAPDLELSNYGLKESDLLTMPASVVGGPVAECSINAAEGIHRLREIYSGTTGFEFDHVHVPAERAWLSESVETRRFAQPMERSAKRALLRRLTDVEGFEKFLHQTYLGQKRFSIEGNDILVPMLDEIVHAAAADGVREIILGMAHRGRLNVMTHVLGKPYAMILGAFEGARWRGPDMATDATTDFSGDVKYHLGARLLRGEHGVMVEVPMVLAPNPSHLEAVNPVVAGMARASQDVTTQAGEPGWDVKASLPIVIHGDSSFPGQGVVAETLNFSALEGYSTGGTIHIIVNNQIGFTADPADSRSTLYAGDLAKGFEIPVVHVNADDVEACLVAVQMAIAYRDEFQKDFLIDLIGYRRWGHNEGDEPTFTQPKLYATISAHPTVRQIWADALIADGTVTPDEPEAMMKASLDHLAGVRRSVTDGAIPVSNDTPVPAPRREVDTAIPANTLREYNTALHEIPDGFTLNSKLVRQWNRRAHLLDADDGQIDWAHAESLAFASILAGGTPIRFTGQDAQRGTFSQRHLTLHDQNNGSVYTPLEHLPQAKASFVVYNSPLSELAAIGYEYGYSVQAPERLVIWEAQFGDFSNGAQIMIDQFITAARSKWRVEPALVMLLPHGYEGQGPEHSSARVERYLQLSAGDNIRVANCTTAAQYFHLMRRQAALLSTDPRPLIIFSPKSLLRNPAASSTLADLTNGTFQPVLDDPLSVDRREKVSRLVLCSGKVAIDLDASPERPGATSVAITRVEQLAPFQQSALRTTIERYPNLAEIVWLQEEPRNMGAWTFMESRLRALTRGELPINYIGRPERASPAEGSAELHSREQARIVAAAFSNVPAAARGKTRPSEGNGSGDQDNGHREPENATKGRARTSKSRS